MTKLAPGASVKRETSASVRGRTIVLIVGDYTVKVGEKGSRRSTYYEVPIRAIHDLGARLKARADWEQRSKGRR